MIDLETMDTRPSAVILSIGAVKFDPATGELGDTFHKKVHALSQARRTTSDDTIAWWQEQSEEAREAAFGGTLNLPGVLFSFSQWLGDNPIVWGNGATFDISILESAYEHNPPWHYRSVRDMRTLVALAPDVMMGVEFQGTEHVALDDARHQARVVSAVYRELGLKT
jgi:hypothetical protein